MAQVLRTYDGRGAFEHYLRAALRRACQREFFPASPGPYPEPEGEDEEGALGLAGWEEPYRALLQALRRALPREQVLLVAMFAGLLDGEAYGVKECAYVLGLSPRRVRRLWARAKPVVRDRLGAAYRNYILSLRS